ncbi:hypothetical protein CORC01_14086 [Colletotrichum orchidophilum]|uniref:Uncharacterized protein n=1 Tax=Colletotrichum orchidophilum TaxID=1209926 RepID=A0A1G4ANC5_9PEZI|nr:uncharacterized protein CORC01_14086 [Colletotrichum orchidophilum]OHE90621.1 hypothetical protein CORC01_14086 [Colletotrichum orchidophilum]
MDGGMQALFSRFCGWCSCIGRSGKAGKGTWSPIQSVAETEVSPLGRTIPSIHRPSLAGCLTAHFLLFRPVDFSQLPIARRLCHPNSVFNSPFPPSCLLLTIFPPFRFLSRSPSLSPNHRHTLTNNDQLGSSLLLLSSYLLSTISSHPRFVTTQRRRLETISRADRHRQASQTRNPLPDYRHSLGTPRPSANRRTYDEGFKPKSAEKSLSGSCLAYTRISLPRNPHALSPETRADRTLVTDSRPR